jgi:hypothetical protein
MCDRTLVELACRPQQPVVTTAIVGVFPDAVGGV